MRTLPLAAANEIYTCTSKVEIHIHRAAYPEGHDFSLLLERFERDLRQAEEEDEYWSLFVRRLRRCRFELCAAPLPAPYLHNRAEDLASGLGVHLAQCEAMYPQYATKARDLLGRAVQVLQIGTTPLLAAIEGITQDVYPSKPAVLIKDTRLILVAEKAIHEYPQLQDIEVVGLSQVCGAVCYDQLVVIGPPHWFASDAYIFSASRARVVHLIMYDWIHDYWKVEPAFVQSTRGKAGHWNTQPPVESKGVSEDQLISAADLLPIVQLSDAPLDPNSKDRATPNPDAVEARAFLLEGRYAVFLEGDADTSTLVIDLADEEGTPVRRLELKHIQPGMFILLRTSGGGDYIVPVADKILGKDAARARAHQQRWKELLRAKVLAHGALAISIDLLDYGSGRANESNVRNWMSPRSIKTADYNDFLAIMRLTGLEQEAQDYWKQMELINSAHRKAGFRMRDALLEQVRQTDLRDLERLGRMEFELSGTGAGCLTAYRVAAISPDQVMVSAHRLGHPFSVGD